MAKTNIEYDAEVIQQFAADLYKRAKSVVRTYAASFGILGLFFHLYSPAILRSLVGSL